MDMEMEIENDMNVEIEIENDMNEIREIIENEMNVLMEEHGKLTYKIVKLKQDMEQTRMALEQRRIRIYHEWNNTRINHYGDKRIDYLMEESRENANKFTERETKYLVELTINEADQFELATKKAIWETKYEAYKFELATEKAFELATQKAFELATQKAMLETKSEITAKRVRINNYKEILIRKNLILKLVC